MLENVREDLRHKLMLRGLPPSLASYVRICGSEGSFAQLVYRATRFCQTRGLGLPAFFLYRVNAFLGHVVIGRDADIGPGFVLLHSSGTVINTHVKAGKNLVLEHAVTLGEVRGQSPVLGDNVYIGAGAKVIGAVKVGYEHRIGANAVVTKDLPDGATAVGVPARVIRIYGKPVASGSPGERARVTMTTVETRGPASSRQPDVHSTPAMRGENIICFAKDWNLNPTSNHHVMIELAERNRVLWLNSIGMRTPSLKSGRDLKTIWRKLLTFGPPKNVQDDLWVFTPLVLPFPYSKAATELNAKILRGVRAPPPVAARHEPVPALVLPPQRGQVHRRPRRIPPRLLLRR